MQRSATCPRGVKPWGPASRFHLFALSQLGFRLLGGARTAERRKTPLIEFTEVKMSDVTVTPLKKKMIQCLYFSGWARREGRRDDGGLEREEPRALHSVLSRHRKMLSRMCCCCWIFLYVARPEIFQLSCFPMRVWWIWCDRFLLFVFITYFWFTDIYF